MKRPAVPAALLDDVECGVGLVYGALMGVFRPPGSTVLTPTLTVTHGRVVEALCAILRSATACSTLPAAPAAAARFAADQYGDDLFPP